jgi:hypothetical protein
MTLRDRNNGSDKVKSKSLRDENARSHRLSRLRREIGLVRSEGGAGLADLLKEGAEVGVDGGVGNFEAFGGDPVSRGAHAAGAGTGIDDPDIFYAHAAVVFAAGLQVGVGIVRGKDFDDEERWLGEDVWLGAGAEDDEVGDADAGWETRMRVGRRECAVRCCRSRSRFVHD